jgi:LysM repeat protein
MEFEERNERNERPKEPSKNLPMAVLLVLVGIICALLYIGWKYMADDSASSDELTPAPADSVSKVKLPKIEEDNVATATKTTGTAKSTEGLPAISVARIGDKKAATATKVVETPAKTIKVEPKPVEKPKPEPAKVAAIPKGGETMSHTVDAGETFLGIANRYNMKSETLKKMNPNIDPNTGVKVGVTKLNVRIKAIHTVGPGDVLRVVSAKYNVSVGLIMAANKKSKNRTDRGEQLIIPFPTKQ